MRPQTLHTDQYDKSRGGYCDRDPRGVGDLVSDAQQIDEESMLFNVYSQKFRDLIDNDHETDPGLEAGQHWNGDEVRYEAQAQQAREDQYRADERGQRRRGHDELRRIAVRDHESELGTGENGERRRRTHAENARRAKQRVYQHRDESGIKPDGDRQPGHGRVGHCLGENDRGGRQTGDEIEAERALARLLQ